MAKVESIKTLVSANIVKKGFASVEYAGEVRGLNAKSKKAGIVITKKTRGINLQFCNYGNREKVITLKETGQMGTRKATWKAYHKDFKNILSYHRENGNSYLEMQVPENGKFESEWFLNGEPVNKMDLEEYFTPSSWKKIIGDEKPLMVTIGCEKIEKINNHLVY